MATVTNTNVVSAPSRSRISAHTRRQWTWGSLFLLPWIIGFFAFQLLPIVFTVFISFTDYAATSEFKVGNFNFVGFENYQRLFTDSIALPSMGVTLKFPTLNSDVAA